MRNFVLFIGVGLAALASSASAQTVGGTQEGDGPSLPSSSESSQAVDPDIVVIGKAVKGNDRKEIASFARQIIRKPERGTPIGRFFAPICPVALGLPKQFADPLLERVRDNARMAGLQVNKNLDCNGNLYVIFADQTDKFYDEIFWKKGPTLRHLTTPQRSRVFGDNGPVKAWNSTVKRNPGGMAMLAGSTQYTPISGKMPANNQQYLLSRLRTATSKEVLRAYVAFDIAAVQGMPIQQIADYATMRTLAPTSEASSDGIGARDTILTLFNDIAAPEGMTVFDRAMLSSLYSASLTMKPRTLFGKIGSKTIKMENKN